MRNQQRKMGSNDEVVFEPVAARCKRCDRPENLAEPLLEGVCPDCLRKAVRRKEPKLLDAPREPLFPTFIEIGQALAALFAATWQSLFEIMTGLVMVWMALIMLTGGTVTVTSQLALITCLILSFGNRILQAQKR